MSTPTETRRPRRLVLLLGAGAAAILVVLVAVLVSGGGTDDSDAAGSPSSSTSAPSTSLAPAPATTVPPPTPSASGPTEDVDALPTALAAVGLQDEAQTGDGVTARLVDVSVVQAEGQGPGSVSGRALQVTVEVRNGTAAALSLDGVDVTADSGSDHAPAAPVADGQTRGLLGSTAPGATSSGTYLFSLPAEADTVTVLVGYQAGAPLMVFTGDV